MEPFIGQIIMFAGNFAPRGWAFCNGQLINITENPALYSVIGITYGGDGRTTFALPDLRGRVPVHPGQGSGLTRRNLGEKGGLEKVSLSLSELPAHSHRGTASLNANNEASEVSRPEKMFPSMLSGGVTGYASRGKAKMNSGVVSVSISRAGGNVPHPNMQPYLGVQYIIALEGVFPPRS